ncbi:hypothetical protein POVWA2_028670 [Plasmodium ovale wallikeri]|uniref:Uncharacterized protein n=1 Tax=Plasmodium ovale wallikeri TaxID=864142 RepID=A0A1A8YX07_PLAOA|nr:hypothetical protein POVWA1_028820 [Plasmodium ovale wallikeri]SBT36138.1 hypothetical protein POVWA2_028670 [Plasmodium ovale wallikeri]
MLNGKYFFDAELWHSPLVLTAQGDMHIKWKSTATYIQQVRWCNNACIRFCTNSLPMQCENEQSRLMENFELAKFDVYMKTYELIRTRTSVVSASV